MITLLFKPQFKVLNQWGYFFIQIFPAVVGTITASFLRGITVTLSRITPFILCAAPTGSTAGKTILREYFPDPSIRDAFTTESFILSYAWILFIAGNFILGFKASLLNTDMTEGYREAIVATWALYPLICIYSFIALFMVAVILKLELAGSTGLRWDPVSLADHLVLFRHSNFLRFFEGTDMADRDSMSNVLSGRPLRLGYWIRVDGANNTYWHGFGLLESDINELESRIQPGATRKSKYTTSILKKNLADWIDSISRICPKPSVSLDVYKHETSIDVHLDNNRLRTLWTIHSGADHRHGRRIRYTILSKLGSFLVPIRSHFYCFAVHVVLGGFGSVHSIHTTIHAQRLSSTSGGESTARL